MYRIFIVEDDAAIAGVIRRHLEGLLFVHHFYSIKPSQSVPLTLLSCLFSYSTYTFLTTISQFDFLSIDVPSPPNFANFSPQEMVHIQRIVAALSKPGIGANGKSIPFLLEWLTRLHRQIGLNKYHST